MTTRCRNDECPFKVDGSCNHNIWTDGLKCEGIEIGYHYHSQQQGIYSDYVRAAIARGEEPMPRNIYFEF